MAASVLSLYVINKSGGLIYNRDFVQRAAGRIDVSDAMRLGSIWFSLHAIAAQLSPTPNAKTLKSLHADTFHLHCLHVPSGTTFFIITNVPAPNQAQQHAQRAADVLQAVYAAYAKYVLRNPFYETEMPIRCELFDAALSALLSR